MNLHQKIETIALIHHPVKSTSLSILVKKNAEILSVSVMENDIYLSYISSHTEEEWINLLIFGRGYDIKQDLGYFIGTVISDWKWFHVFKNKKYYGISNESD